MKLREAIQELERECASLEPSADERDNWTRQATEYAADFIDTIDQRKAFQAQDTSEALYHLPIAEAGYSMGKVMDVLRNAVDSPGINPASGGHLGYIPGGGIYPSALGDFLADTTNRYAGIFFANPGAVRMENMLLRWMADLIGFPESAHGNLCSGGSIANLIGITTARDAMGITPADISQSVIYINPQTHHCIHKAIRIAGLGEAHLREVPLDAQFKMRPDNLEDLVLADKAAGLRPFLIVASLGSTDTGAVDPVDAIADVAEAEDLWLQVDAAYGGFFVLVDDLREKFAGVERADSYIVDPHKGLFLPYGIGAVLVRDAHLLHKSHFYRANYMQDARSPSDILSPADLSPELTKHFRGLRMWLPLQLFGLAPFRAALREKVLLARYFYREIQQRGFEVGPEPEFSVVIYRFVPDGRDANAFNADLITSMHRDGRIFISSTMIEGQFWLRMAALCFRTHLHHIDLLLEMLTEHRDRLLRNDKG